jgi:carbon storage regulator
MLVLTRKKSESISIGNDVVITITQIGAGKVKLGIVAPAHVRIRRSELASFETQPRVENSGGSDSSKIGAEAETDDSLEAETANESAVDFTTEYAAEIEDQMRCVLSY